MGGPAMTITAAANQVPGDGIAASGTRPLVIDDEFTVVAVVGFAGLTAVSAPRRCGLSVHVSLLPAQGVEAARVGWAACLRPAAARTRRGGRFLHVDRGTVSRDRRSPRGTVAVGGDLLLRRWTLSKRTGEDLGEAGPSVGLSPSRVAGGRQGLIVDVVRLAGGHPRLPMGRDGARCVGKELVGT
jgi:hypothetical protein